MDDFPACGSDLRSRAGRGSFRASWFSAPPGPVIQLDDLLRDGVSYYSLSSTLALPVPCRWMIIGSLALTHCCHTWDPPSLASPHRPLASPLPVLLALPAGPPHASPCSPLQPRLFRAHRLLQLPVSSHSRLNSFPAPAFTLPEVLSPEMCPSSPPALLFVPFSCPTSWSSRQIAMRGVSSGLPLSATLVCTLGQMAQTLFRLLYTIFRVTVASCTVLKSCENCAADRCCGSPISVFYCCLQRVRSIRTHRAAPQAFIHTTSIAHVILSIYLSRLLVSSLQLYILTVFRASTILYSWCLYRVAIPGLTLLPVKRCVPLVPQFVLTHRSFSPN